MVKLEQVLQGKDQIEEDAKSGTLLDTARCMFETACDSWVAQKTGRMVYHWARAGKKVLSFAGTWSWNMSTAGLLVGIPFVLLYESENQAKLLMQQSMGAL